jgi:hypothetical protein
MSTRQRSDKTAKYKASFIYTTPSMLAKISFILGPISRTPIVYYQISFQPKEGAFYIWKLFWSLWKDMFSIFKKYQKLDKNKARCSWYSDKVLGRRDVVSYHKWMTSYNFFDFGVTCSTFISLCPNIRNTGLYFYLAFDIF